MGASSSLEEISQDLVNSLREREEVVGNRCGNESVQVGLRLSETRVLCHHEPDDQHARLGYKQWHKESVSKYKFLPFMKLKFAAETQN